jgi:ABC-type nitrate/sulfonate/bicarbonate transport system substrate-binding protein
MRVFLSALAGVCVLLSASFAAPLPVRADESLSIIAGSSAPGIFDILEIVAAGAGYYQAEHLTVTKDYASSASTAAQLVSVGKADVASLSAEPVLTGYEKGLRLQFFLSRQARYSYVMAVTSDSPIRLIADFKNAQIGETNIGSASEVSARSMLAGAGLTPSDYTFVPIGTGAVGLTAITAHRVGGLSLPYLEIVNDTVVGHLSFRVFRHPILKDIGNVGYAGLPATLAAKADALKHFSRAIVKAALFVRVNPAGAARLYLQGTQQQVTPDALATMTKVLTLLEDDLPAADPSNKRIGAMSIQGLSLYSKFLVDAGFAHQTVTGSAVATDQFIGFANDFDHKALIAQAKSVH